MDNERHSEFNAWRQRLEEPGALPGIGLADKEAVWDKLYERLDKGPRRRIPVWIWAAAACILLALIPAAFLLSPRGKHPGQAVTTTDRLPIRNPATAGARPSPKPGPVTTRTPPPSRSANPRNQNIARNPNNSHNPNIAYTPDPKHPAPFKPIFPSIIKPSLSDTFFTGKQDLLHPLPPVIAAAPPRPPKKELRVIHINELEPPQSAPSTTGPRQKPGRLYIRLIPSEQEPFRPATTYEPARTDHPLITLKHSQNP